MLEKRNFKFKGRGEKLITADLTFKKSQNPQALCVFSHGFKGFKDWGVWPLTAEVFAHHELPFFKFNFSHNGTSPSDLSEIHDLEAFAGNNISMELDELALVIAFLESKSSQLEFNWNGQIFLIGHSLGGSIALLQASGDSRISKLVTWGSPSDFGSFIDLADHVQWKNKGRIYVPNLRTGQALPIDYQFYEDLIINGTELYLTTALENIEQDFLIVHGANDLAVPVHHAHTMYSSVPHSIMIMIEGADHTFGIEHPMPEKKISHHFARVMDETIEFLTL